uniref:Uncharacterized protein n=1 Tax=Candidatus Kentrum sp. MB TaxID=2138164 RepID=A0A450XEX2_9GAMM|nr:MAG: hypothetical protein BECKMB1821G_GA0114241_103032 [Candidatus Kentron sp. MB]
MILLRHLSPLWLFSPSNRTQDHPQSRPIFSIAAIRSRCGSIRRTTIQSQCQRSILSAETLRGPSGGLSRSWAAFSGKSESLPECQTGLTEIPENCRDAEKAMPEGSARSPGSWKTQTGSSAGLPGSRDGLAGSRESFSKPPDGPLRSRRFSRDSERLSRAVKKLARIPGKVARMLEKLIHATEKPYRDRRKPVEISGKRARRTGKLF